MGLGSPLIERLEYARTLLRETPVLRLADDQVELYAKLEFLNGVGSIKDRPAYWVLKAAIERGEIGEDTTIIESSSGNFASALAVFCRILRLRFIPVVDPLISPVYEKFLRLHCEEVIKAEDCDDSGGYLKSRLCTVQKLLASIPGSFWTNQYRNTDAMTAHYELTGEEICRAMPGLDYVFLGVSSGGTIAGVSRRLKERLPSVKVIAVDSEGSVIFGQPPKKRYIAGIGSSISPPLVEQALIDDVVIVPEAETVSACHDLLNRSGLFVGGSTGTVYSAIRGYFRRRTAPGKPKVLFLCCDRGTAYLHNVYDPQWSAWRTHEKGMASGNPA